VEVVSAAGRQPAAPACDLQAIDAERLAGERQRGRRLVHVLSGCDDVLPGNRGGEERPPGRARDAARDAELACARSPQVGQRRTRRREIVDAGVEHALEVTGLRDT